MADPKAPDLFQRVLMFMRDADEWSTPVDVLRSAEDAGLAIVSEADRKVLEACAAFPTAALRHDAYTNRNELSDLSLRWTEAELARRAP